MKRILFLIAFLPLFAQAQFHLDLPGPFKNVNATPGPIDFWYYDYSTGTATTWADSGAVKTKTKFIRYKGMKFQISGLGEYGFTKDTTYLHPTIAGGSSGFVSQTILADVLINGATGTKSVRFGSSTVSNSQVNNFAVYAAGQINIHTTAGANIQAVNTDASLSSVGQVTVSSTGSMMTGGAGNAVSVPFSGNVAITGKLSTITNPTRNDTLTQVKVRNRSTGEEQYRDASTFGGSSGLPSQTGNSGKYLTTDGTSASWGATALPAADATHDGYLAMGDWSTFNNKSTLPTPTVDGYVLALVTGAPAWVAGGGGGLTGLTTNGVLVATGSTTAATPAYLSFVNSSSVSTLNINEAAASSQAAALINLNFTTAGGAAIKGYAGSTDLFNIGFNESAAYAGTSGTTGGRTFAIVDDVAGGGSVRMGMGADGTLYVGPSSSSYAMKVSQAGSTLVNGDITVATTGLYSGIQTFAVAPVFSSTTATQVLYAGASGSLLSDPDMTYAAGGSLTLGRPTTSGSLNFNFGLAAGGGVVWTGDGVSFSTFGVNASGQYGGTASTSGGMTQYYYDIQNSAYRWGTGPSGTFYIGPSASSYALRVTQAGAITAPALVGGPGTFIQTNNTGGMSVQNFPVSTLFNYFADVQSVSTTETDLYTNAVAANTLATNGDKIKAEYTTTLIMTGGATKDVRIYFAGTKIFDTGTLTIGIASVVYQFHVSIIRDGSSSVRCTVESTTPGNPDIQYTNVTGLTFSSTNILKITGQSGAGAATGDVTANMGYVSFLSH